MAKKFTEYSTPMQIAAVVMLLLYAACFIYLAWIFGEHLYRHEWLEAGFQAAMLLLGGFWSANRKNKKKAKLLEVELKGLRASRKSSESAAFMKGWQAGIDFQRRIPITWATGRRASQG